METSPISPGLYFGCRSTHRAEDPPLRVATTPSIPSDSVKAVRVRDRHPTELKHPALTAIGMNGLPGLKIGTRFHNEGASIRFREPEAKRSLHLHIDPKRWDRTRWVAKLIYCPGFDRVR
jgi:hypothetical protein